MIITTEHLEGHPRGASGRWIERLMLGVVLVAVASFYIWTVSSNGEPWHFGPKQEDYYNRLLHGFINGHLYMNIRVPEALLKLDDPYDPQKRPPGAGLHDASYYRGRYYLYFGAAPVVTLMLPFQLLTGMDLPARAASIVFVYTGFLASAGVWLLIRRRYFPSVGAWVSVPCVLTLGIASLGPVLLRRSSFWELPIASGYCFAMITLLCVYLSLHSVRRAGWWFAGAGLSLGLAVGSRPTYVFATILMAVPLVWRWWEGRAEGKWRWLPGPPWWRLAVAGATPLAFIGGLIGLYNYLRFGNPLEFGLSYQLTGNIEAKVQHFRASFVPFNFYVYFLAPAQWSRYFPFVQVINAPTQPRGYYGWEYTYGVLANLPIAWLALAAPFGALRQGGREGVRLLAWIGSACLLSGSMAGILVFFNTAAARYMLDFVPVIVLLGCVGVAVYATEIRRLPWPWMRGLSRLVCGGLLLFSGFFALMLSFQLHELLRQLNPQAHRQLARVFDYPSYWMEKLTGTQHGPLEIKLRFPKDRLGKLQPLVVTGRSFSTDYVFVYYFDDRHVQIGFDHTSRGMQLSAPLPIDYDAVHEMRVDLGSLYPPEGHPFFAGRNEREMTVLTRWLRITVDGKVVIEGYQDFYDASPESIFIGCSPTSDAYGRRFTGEILEARHAPIPNVVEPRGVYGGYRVRLSFPAKVTNRSEPLVSAGVRGRADVCYVKFLEGDHLRFACDHWGVGACESDILEVDRSIIHEVEIRMGALFPPKSTVVQAALRRSIQIKLDGRIVWAQPVPFYEVDAVNISLGRNTPGSSMCEPAFTGRIYEIARFMDGEDVPVPAYGAVRMEVMLPRGHLGRSEPLVVAGEAGHGDLLSIQYVDDGHVRFGLDHWGSEFYLSDPVAVDYALPQVLDLRLGSLERKADRTPGTTFNSTVEVALNGNVVWSRPVRLHACAIESVTFGHNSIGGSMCDEYFSGDIVSIDRPGQRRAEPPATIR